MSLTLKDFDTIAKPDWCPGCGNFGIQAALKRALLNLGIAPENTVMVTGIGCGPKLTHWLDVYGLHTIHGRALPAATAVKLANPKLTVVAASGDGDGYGIGMGHFVHTMRRNVDITYLVQNNMVYGLTKGQATPTSSKGYKSPSTPFGIIEEPLNPIALALTMGATYIARGFSGDVLHLVGLIEGAIKHKGFAFIDIFQPCVTFNKINTYAYFKEHTYKLDDEIGYDPSNFKAAMDKALQTDKLPIGLFFKAERPTYEDMDPGLTSGNPVEADIQNIDIKPLMEAFL
jgi:2-oxoglutarate/2-oxoacid ferredoxin oxidoreductase subunit beta